MATEDLTGKPWTAEELDATVGAYFGMLRLQLAGSDFKKSDVRARLQPRLRGRSPKAIDLKFCNISAVLDELGLDWVDGYKPMEHYQHALRPAVLEYLDDYPDLARRGSGSRSGGAGRICSGSGS